jgi:hypothetical protein
MMSDDEERPNRPIPMETHPAAAGPVGIAPHISQLPPGRFGMAVFARARYMSEARQIECYTNLVRVKSALLIALNEQQRLFGEYVIQSEELQNLDTLRATVRLRVQVGLKAATRDLRAIEREQDLADARAEAEIARLKYETAQARKATDDLGKPAAPQSREPTLADQLVAGVTELDRIDAAFQEMRERKIREAGGEEHLSQEERDRLKQFELMRDNLLNTALTGMFE